MVQIITMCILNVINYAGVAQGGAAKVNLAKLVGHMPSESDDGGELNPVFGDSVVDIQGRGRG